MSMQDLNKLIINGEITVQDMQEIYNRYGIGFIIRDGKIKGFTK